MLPDLLHNAGQLFRSMSTVEWIVAIALALTLGLAVVKQLAKTALLLVVLFAAGFVLLHGRLEHWTF